MFAYAPAEAPSAGYAVVTERFVALLSADATPDIVAAVHRLLDGPNASPDHVLAMLADPASAERFALVEILDLSARIFGVTMRGDILVDLGGASTSRFTWPQGTNWLRGEAYGVESLHLSLAPIPASVQGLPLRNGAVQASAISVGVDLATAPVIDPISAPGQAQQRAAEADDLEPTVDRRPQAIDLASFSREPAWTLKLPDGNELDAAPQIVVGRRPWRSDPDETQTYYVVAPSPQREISGKHVEFTVVGGELHARDLDSTNGTLLMSPHQAPRLLHGGADAVLEVGDVLDLGEGFRIVVGTRR